MKPTHGGKRPNSGRKKGRRTICRSITFQPETLAKLEEMRKGRSRSATVNALIEENEKPLA